MPHEKLILTMKGKSDHHKHPELMAQSQFFSLVPSSTFGVPSIGSGPSEWPTKGLSLKSLRGLIQNNYNSNIYNVSVRTDRTRRTNLTARKHVLPHIDLWDMEINCCVPFTHKSFTTDIVNSIFSEYSFASALKIF